MVDYGAPAMSPLITLRLSALKHLTDLTLPDNGADRRLVRENANVLH